MPATVVFTPRRPSARRHGHSRRSSNPAGYESLKTAQVDLDQVGSLLALPAKDALDSLHAS